MFISKRKHYSELDKLQIKLSAQAALIAQLKIRAAMAESTSLKMLEESKKSHQKASEYNSAGEAAYAYANDYEECKPHWDGANQDLWEHAACGAILYGRQRAADAQIAYFKLGACVPYALASHDPSKVMTAELTDAIDGGLTIKVNGEHLRDLEIWGLEDTIEWFSNLVTSPPGWIAI